LYRRHRAVIVASLPAVNEGQTEAQRGVGVWETSIGMLQRLNRLGYGLPDSGLELDLASNPAGAFLPPAQGPAERRFRADLHHRHGIEFNTLLTFANVPLGRFRHWLTTSGNLDAYRERLAQRFNPVTLPGLMCRTFISVDWDGYLYDCDFNLAAGLHHGPRRTHITELSALPPEGTAIPTGEHCFACTAGAGFTCGGSIE
jgi:radical SAM/Cys-rich protein